MLTFNLQSSRTKNYYTGHEPSNYSSNCWGGREQALVLRIEQARELLTTWLKGCNIVIATTEAEPIRDEQLKKEMHCLDGGSWYD